VKGVGWTVAHTAERFLLTEMRSRFKILPTVEALR